MLEIYENHVRGYSIIIVHICLITKYISAFLFYILIITLLMLKKEEPPPIPVIDAVNKHKRRNDTQAAVSQAFVVYSVHRK